MGAMPKLKIKEDLHYRPGSTNEAKNCRFCKHFEPDYPIYGIGSGHELLRRESRCRLMGLKESRRYNVRMDYTCDAQLYRGE